MSIDTTALAHLDRAVNGSEYVVPSMGEFVMTDNLDIDVKRCNGNTANVTVRESEEDGYLVLDVTTEDGNGAGLYLNREGALALIQALAQYATALA